MIPIGLVTGFLGSGKTTLLRRIIDTHRDRKIVYLINEFSALDIDGALLTDAEDSLVTIPGGSIFCRCLVGEFIEHLRALPQRFHRPDDPLAGVVIEASGVASPKVIEQMLRESGLHRMYELATIVSITDPGSLPKLVHTLPNISAQIEAADVVLINKIDLFTPARVDATEALVREINATSPILRTVRCAVDLDPFAGGHVHALEGEYALCADPNYARFALAFTGPVDVDALAAELRALAPEIYRAKGFVPTAQGLVYLDFSEAGLTFKSVAEDMGPPGLAIIAHGDHHVGVDEFARRHGAMGD